MAYGGQDLHDVFHFLDYCMTSRLHPRRPIKRNNVQRASYSCQICGRSTTSSKEICIRCGAALGERDNFLKRESLKMRSEERANEYRHMLALCSKRGTCDVLAAHHSYLENDPDRLSTKFLVNLICGVDYKEGSKIREMLPEVCGNEDLLR